MNEHHGSCPASLLKQIPFLHIKINTRGKHDKAWNVKHQTFCFNYSDLACIHTAFKPQLVPRVHHSSQKIVPINTCYYWSQRVILRSEDLRAKNSFSSCKEKGTGPCYIILAVRGERSSSVWKNWVKGSLETRVIHKIHLAVLEKSGLWYMFCCT